MTTLLKTISFEEIRPIWSEKLWPGRKSTIKPMSSIKYLGGYDCSIYRKYNPTFFSVQIDGKIVGVNSGFRTNENSYRCRGIWIDLDFRGKNLSKMLFTAAEQQAMLEKCTHLWSMPRISAWPAYKAFGFKQTSDWFDEGVEFGPNCYVLKDIVNE